MVIMGDYDNILTLVQHHEIRCPLIPALDHYRPRVLSYPLEKYINTSLIDCMVFNAIFNSISVSSQRPVHLSMLSWISFNQYSAQYSFQAAMQLSRLTVVESKDGAERGMNPAAMFVISPRREYWQSRGLNQ